MCVICGCNDAEILSAERKQKNISSEHNQHNHSTEADANHPHHDHVSENIKNGDLHFGAGSARLSVPGISQERAIKIETNILAENNRWAAENRNHFKSHGMTTLNLMSSPGSGKTTLLCATIESFKRRNPQLSMAVIEGDQQTSFDAERIRQTGVAAIQVNTGKGCHLDAPMVAKAFSQLHHHKHSDDASDCELLFIENVGNLVCPAMWDLGEHAKVTILSVTEGEDKPLKYPDMFAASKLMILNKIDLLPHISFDVERCIEFARRVNPNIEVIQLSATSGEGMNAWLDWLEKCIDKKDTAFTLRQRVAELEAQVAQYRSAAIANAATK